MSDLVADYIERLSRLPHAKIMPGPTHPDNPSEDLKPELDDYFRSHPCVNQDAFFKEFEYACPDFSMQKLLPDGDLAWFEPDFHGLAMCPVVDEGFLEKADQGYFVVCTVLERRRPARRRDEWDGLVEHRFALKCEGDGYWGIHVAVVEDGSDRIHYKPYCTDFRQFLDRLIERKGRFLS